MSLLRRMANLFSRSKLEREIDAELQSHIEMRTEDAIARGAAPAAARREAMLRFGNNVVTRERVAEQDAALWLRNIWWDSKYVWRQFCKAPAFSITAIGVLALGIGASSALFAFVDAALIRPLPYTQPSQLADVTENLPLFPRANLSYLDYLDWRRGNTVFRSLEVYRGRGYLMATGEGTEPVRGAVVSAGFFRTLGVTPALGSGFRADADQPQAPKVVLLSYGFWQRQFAGRMEVLGQTLTLDDEPRTIVGVLPQKFQFALEGDAELWVPLQVGPPGPQTPFCYTDRSSHCLYGVGRLRDGVSIAQARSQMKSIAANLAAQYPDSNRGQGASVLPLSEAMMGTVRPILLTLLAGAGLLLAIAFVNVSSLLLVRTEGRRREMALRRALGASRGRLLRHFVTEALLLVAFGGGIGLLTAGAAIQVLFRLIPKEMRTNMPYFDGLGLNRHVLGFALAVCIGATVLFAATPLIRLATGSRPDFQGNLAEGTKGSSGVTWRRFGSNLVALELAIAMVLLVGAGLLGKSFYRLLHVELGFQPGHLATVEVVLPGKQFAKDDQQRAAAREILRQLSGLPGVSGVGTSNDLAVNGNGDTRWVRFVGRAYNGEHNEVLERQASSGYLRTLGARLERGRYFTDEEDNTKPKVVIINQAFARKYFPGEDPVGKQFGNYHLDPDSIWTVVGVVDDIREGGLDEEVLPAFYEAYNQNPDTYMQVVVRTKGDERALLPEMVRAVHAVDPGIAVSDETTLSARINDSPAAYLRRSAAWLVGGFASLALLMSVVGLYGVITFSVSQRTREIGVRMALGAARGAVTRLILKEAGRLIAVGVIAGLVCSVGAVILMRKLLFGTQAWDVPTLAAVALVLGAPAMLASYFPARRAASINPVDALRAE